MMRLAVYQMQAGLANIDRNLEKIEDAARTAAGNNADLLVTPELSLSGYGAGDQMKSLAMNASGAPLKALQRISSAHDIALIAGFPELSGNNVYNSTAFVDGQKEPIIYRKSHLYGDYEKSLFTAEEPKTVKAVLNGIVIGMLICYDVEFPENVRRLALAGVELVLVPTALPAGDYSSFIARKLVPTRAFENQVTLAYANHSGNDGAFEYQGQSVIVGADGTLLAEGVQHDEALLYAEVDPAQYESSKQQNSYLADLEIVSSKRHS
ncbi:nitrilase-related carbon-nitrogen hydrolase [Sneathiella aquimaris]|uniref:nitrilase-related carbon-nitrogen hydrolase n=1 Tax=Sneathiella aquimaris TaxID=2599305 RepID=UPI00146B999E